MVTHENKRSFRHVGSRTEAPPQFVEVDPDRDNADGFAALAVADLFDRTGEHFVAAITVPPFRLRHGLVVVWGSRAFAWSGSQWREATLYVCGEPFGIDVARSSEEIVALESAAGELRA